MQRSPADAPASAGSPAKTGEEKKQESPNTKKEGSGSAAPISAIVSKPKKFHNGWTRQLETLVAEWSDKAACYRWMHDKTEAVLGRYNMYFTIPVIILSTLTGTANFGVDSLLPDPSYSKYASAIIGGVSILTGIISTIANFLRYAQGSEAHRVAGVSWGKFQRFISTELSLHPNERMDAMSFLKTARIELDRLIEQSPTIPQKIVVQFETEFKGKHDIKRPENTKGGIEHTKFFDDRESRVAKVASEAAFLLQQKKGVMRQLIENDFDKYIAERTRAEREQAEHLMLAELSNIARTAAEAAATEIVQAKLARGTGLVASAAPPTAPLSSNSATAAVQRSPINIPENTVQSARKVFEAPQKAPVASSAAPIARTSVAAMAAAVGAARQPTSQSSAPSSNIRLEILPETHAVPPTPAASPVVGQVSKK